MRTRISLGLMTTGLTSSRRLIFDGLVIVLELINWDELVHYQRRVNVVYAEAGRSLVSEVGMF